MTHSSLALKLRVLRAERALTIEQAAERAGVTPETISDAERGKRHPYVPTLRKLAAAYNVPVEELLASEAEPAELAELVGSPKAEAPQSGPSPEELRYEEIEVLGTLPHDGHTPWPEMVEEALRVLGEA